MTESTLYRRLYRHDKGLVFMQRIETAMALGVPDLFVQVKPGAAVWIELKIITRAALPVVPEWRPGQIGWAMLHRAAGGLWAIVFHYKDQIWFSPHVLREYHDEDFFKFYSFRDPEFLYKIGRHLHEKPLE